MDSPLSITVAVCGRSRTGKSQLIARAAHHPSERFALRSDTSVGVEFRTLVDPAGGGTLVKLHFWRACPNRTDRNETITSTVSQTSTYTSANRISTIDPARVIPHVAFLVYDVTDKHSVAVITAQWREQHLRSSRVVVVVGNKADLLPDGGASLMTDEALQQGALPPDAVADSTAAVQTAAAFCKNEQLPHHVVSAKTGAGVHKVLDEVTSLSLTFTPSAPLLSKM